MALPSDYFGRDAILTLGGASGIVLVVNTTLKALIPRFNTVWPAFLLSLALGIGRAFLGGKDWLDYLLGALNGCLIFLTALGANQVAGKAEVKAKKRSRAGKTKEQQFALRPEEPKFFKPWF